MLPFFLHMIQMEHVPMPWNPDMHKQLITGQRHPKSPTTTCRFPSLLLCSFQQYLFNPQGIIVHSSHRHLQMLYVKLVTISFLLQPISSGTLTVKKMPFISVAVTDHQSVNKSNVTSSSPPLYLLLQHNHCAYSKFKVRSMVFALQIHYIIVYQCSTLF